MEGAASTVSLGAYASFIFAPIHSSITPFIPIHPSITLFIPIHPSITPFIPIHPSILLSSSIHSSIPIHPSSPPLTSKPPSSLVNFPIFSFLITSSHPSPHQHHHSSTHLPIITTSLIATYSPSKLHSYYPPTHQTIQQNPYHPTPPPPPSNKPPSLEHTPIR